MAQKTTQKAPAAAAAAASAAPAEQNTATAAPAKPATKKVDTFRFVKAVAEGEKLAPQARVIVNAIQVAGTNGISRENLCSALVGKLVTRQPIGRIVTYYQKALCTSGYIAIDSVEVAA